MEDLNSTLLTSDPQLSPDEWQGYRSDVQHHLLGVSQRAGAYLSAGQLRSSDLMLEETRSLPTGSRLNSLEAGQMHAQLPFCGPYGDQLLPFNRDVPLYGDLEPPGYSTAVQHPPHGNYGRPPRHLGLPGMQYQRVYSPPGTKSAYQGMQYDPAVRIQAPYPWMLSSCGEAGYPYQHAPGEVVVMREQVKQHLTQIVELPFSPHVFLHVSRMRLTFHLPICALGASWRERGGSR
jgi:hypothetical protein